MASSGAPKQGKVASDVEEGLSLRIFMKGLDLSQAFFVECGRPVLERNFPELVYTAGLLGYGSDVLGYDDEVSQDHMWGPRFYLFVRPEDRGLADNIMEAFSRELPGSYRGYGVHFGSPDSSGVRKPEPLEGAVSPLIFISTFPEFLREYLGAEDVEAFTFADWLCFSEHKLLAVTSGKLFHDGLGIAGVREKLACYPREVRQYLAAALWNAVAEEQAFVKRCGMVGDDMGSRIISARMAERLMRLMFLYSGIYAPYSKWFGTAFGRRFHGTEVADALSTALSTADIYAREDALVRAQLLVAETHNISGLGASVEVQVESYFGREIKVIYAERIAAALEQELRGTALEGTPLIGSMSQLQPLECVTDTKRYHNLVKRLYL